MRRLILMRHAKSSWATPGMDDLARPLNPRGKAAAPVMARWLEAQGYLPEVILCSPSKRTRQTVKRMRKAVPALPDPVLVPQHYSGEPEAILAAVHRVPQAAASVMVVGHEPGISATAAMLAGPGGPRVPGQFPTAAVAVFDLVGDADAGETGNATPVVADGPSWAGLLWGWAKLVGFAKPRDFVD